jgi:hypothetical protein
VQLIPKGILWGKNIAQKVLRFHGFYFLRLSYLDNRFKQVAQIIAGFLKLVLAFLSDL